MFPCRGLESTRPSASVHPSHVCLSRILERNDARFLLGGRGGVRVCLSFILHRDSARAIGSFINKFYQGASIYDVRTDEVVKKYFKFADKQYSVV